MWMQLGKESNVTIARDMDICPGIAQPLKGKVKVQMAKGIMVKGIMEKADMEKEIMAKELMAKDSIRDLTPRDMAKEISKGVKGKAKDFRDYVGRAASSGIQQIIAEG